MVVLEDLCNGVDIAIVDNVGRSLGIFSVCGLRTNQESAQSDAEIV